MIFLTGFITVSAFKFDHFFKASALNIDKEAVDQKCNPITRIDDGNVRHCKPQNQNHVLKLYLNLCLVACCDKIVLVWLSLGTETPWLVLGKYPH